MGLGIFGRASGRNTTVRSAVSQVNKPGVWKAVATEFLIAQKVRSKAAGVRVTASATTKALQLISIASPAVADEMSKQLVPVATRAFEQWPIRQTSIIKKTKRGKDRGPGFSKSQLLLVWRARSSTEFSGSIINRADYAAAIKKGATGEKLIFGPGRRAAARAAVGIARALKRQGER